MVRSLVLSITLSALLPTAEAHGSQQAAFEKSLQKIQEEMGSSDWRKARVHLLELLEEHAEESYVLARRTNIEDKLKRCLFWEENEAPGPKDLVSGQLHKYSPATGQLKITYLPDQMEDFESEVLEDLGPLYTHPAPFSRRHTIEIEGKSYAHDLFVLASVELPATWYGVNLGLPGNPGRPAHIIKFEDSRTNKVATGPSATPGKPYRIKVTVEERKITVHLRGKKVLETNKESRQWGQVGFINPGRFEKIVLTGRAERSWIQGLQDKAMSDRWKAFEQDFQAENHLPAWMFAAQPGESGASELDVFWQIPGESRAGQQDLLFEALELLAADKLEEGLELAKTLDRDATSKAFRNYIELLFRAEQGHVSKARILYRRLSRAEPGFLPGELLYARTLASSGDFTKAAELFAEVAARAPNVGVVRGELAHTLLLTGRVEEARKTVKDARAEGLQSTEIDRVDRTLTKLASGPDWPRVHQWESKHYHVLSDIDKPTCKDAADILEQAYKLYAKELGPLQRERKEPFRVYVFSGEASYRNYSQELWGFSAENTRGYYTATIKQLLVWNVSQRDDMLRTVRHEGLHQYVDSLVGPAPKWLNEGLAEYFEIAEKVGGRWSLGNTHKTNRYILAESKLVALPEFLRLSDARFMANAGLHYAQSWAFVHFLLHGDPSGENLLERMLQALAGTDDRDEAFEKAFGEVDLKALDKLFRHYVKTL